jgi:hypothetical protein
MNSVDGQPTIVEHLPIEIFFQIFASFSLGEIITSFFGLNSRIDSIIRCMTGASHVISYNNKKAIDLLHLFPTQIGQLIVTRARKVNFTSLINLRSLTMKYGTCAQFDGIRPEHFPMLEILHIDASKSKKMYLIRFKIIFLIFLICS